MLKVPGKGIKACAIGGNWLSSPSGGDTKETQIENGSGGFLCVGIALGKFRRIWGKEWRNGSIIEGETHWFTHPMTSCKSPISLYRHMCIYKPMHPSAHIHTHTHMSAQLQKGNSVLLITITGSLVHLTSIYWTFTVAGYWARSREGAWKRAQHLFSALKEFIVSREDRPAKVQLNYRMVDAVLDGELCKLAVGQGWSTLSGGLRKMH